MNESLSQIGEKEILNRLKRFMPTGQIEDDTALINPKNKELLINTDILVEDIHFNDITSTPKDVGWKAISVNISDLISSGTEEVLGVTVGLIAPQNTAWNWVEDLYIGMHSALKTFGGTLIGGDCSQGKQKIISITAIGSVGKLNMHRSNALPGDCVISTGPHGLSRLGLALLENDPSIKTSHISEGLKHEAIKRHQRPLPAMEALQMLKRSKPNELSWRAAATDSSDGLLNSLIDLANSSNCKIIIDRKNLPKSINWPEGKKWDSWCINGGEDYELIVCLPPSWAKEFIANYNYGKIIGFVEEGQANVLWTNGESININEYLSFKHF